MSRRPPLPRGVALVGLAAVIALVGALGLRALGAVAPHDKDDEAVAASVQTKAVGDDVHILAPAAAQKAGGLEVRALEAGATALSTQALATVLPLQPLLEQRRGLLTASLDARRAALASDAARLEARRLALLHADDRLVSDKALETAQTSAATEGANLAAARDQTALTTATLAAQWGPVVAGWIAHDSVQLRDLVAGRTVLLQVSPISGAPATRPSRVDILLASGAILRATIVSAAAQSDPKFQNPSYYAIAPASPALMPGVSLTASLPSGASLQGVAVPDEAVVRADGRAFVYVATGAGEFVRRPIVTDTPTASGWLVRQGLDPGTRVVVRGAQLLLSQELKAGGAHDGDER